jgi:hypothetical protein
MTVRLCGLLHELLNCGGKVPVKKLVCLMPARPNVMGDRLCCSRISNCEGLFIYTVVITTCLIFCMLFIVWNNNLCLSDILVLISWGWKDSCTNIPRGDLRFGVRPPERLVALFVEVRVCGLPPSALFLLRNFDPAGSGFTLTIHASLASRLRKSSLIPLISLSASYKMLWGYLYLYRTTTNASEPKFLYGKPNDPYP